MVGGYETDPVNGVVIGERLEDGASLGIGNPADKACAGAGAGTAEQSRAIVRVGERWAWCPVESFL